MRGVHAQPGARGADVGVDRPAVADGHGEVSTGGGKGDVGGDDVAGHVDEVDRRGASAVAVHPCGDPPGRHVDDDVRRCRRRGLGPVRWRQPRRRGRWCRGRRLWSPAARPALSHDPERFPGGVVVGRRHGWRRHLTIVGHAVPARQTSVVCAAHPVRCAQAGTGCSSAGRRAATAARMSSPPSHACQGRRSPSSRTASRAADTGSSRVATVAADPEVVRRPA